MDPDVLERGLIDNTKSRRTGMIDPIKIFVGCASNNEDLESQAVLEWSLRKNTKRELRITWMQLSRDKNSTFYSDGVNGWQTKDWTTPFSAFRWAVCQLCDFRGQAIYSDSDVIYLGDIGDLWDEVFQPGRVVIAKGARGGGRGVPAQRYCVSKWSCSAAAAHLPSISKMQKSEGSHRGLMQWFANNQQLVQPFGTGDWNCLDGEGFPDLNSPKLKAIHYTGIPTQPQLRHALPRLKREGIRHWFRGAAQPHPRADIRALFDKLLEEAAANGYGIERYRKFPYGDYNIRGSGRAAA